MYRQKRPDVFAKMTQGLPLDILFGKAGAAAVNSAMSPGAGKAGAGASYKAGARIYRVETVK